MNIVGIAFVPVDSWYSAFFETVSWYIFFRIFPHKKRRLSRFVGIESQSIA